MNFGELLDAAEERDPRDRALCALLLYTLGRDSEVTDLRIRDLDLTGGWLKVRIHKTGAEDTLPVSAELDAEKAEVHVDDLAEAGVTLHGGS